MMLFVIIIGFMLLSMIVGQTLKNRFKKYSKIQLSCGLTGREVAEKMLRDKGVGDVKVVSVQGFLSDHYNPSNKTINLSPEVYNGKSVAAAAVAAHETGHAVQHATAYYFLQFRSAMVPVVKVSNQAINFVFIAMLIGAFAFSMFSYEFMLYIMIAAQGAITLFTLITLPVEFDATKRGLLWLNGAGITHGEEHTKATKALNLAAMTYVIAALSAITVLLYYVLQLLGNR